jgi:dephospho-CoA kinase
MKIALTGNFYSGQDEISHILNDKNVPVFDADLVLKYILNFSPKHMNKISAVFGEDYYSYGLLRLNLFKKNYDWDKLLNLVEYDLLQCYEKFRKKHSDSTYTVFKFSYLFERNLQEHFDKVICAYRPKNYRKQDMKTYTHLDDLSINNILSNEMGELYKNTKSDYIVHNYNITGDKFSDIVTGLERRIDQIHKSIQKNTYAQKDYEDFYY